MEKEYNTIFDFLKSITETKEDIDFNTQSIKSAYNTFMIDKYISMCNIYLGMANIMNKCYTVPADMHYEFYKSMLPKRKQFFEYVKKTKEDDDGIDAIKNYYEISRREAEDYYKLLDKDQIAEIKAKFDYGK